MAELLHAPTEPALWQRLIADAQDRSGQDLDETLESYLVFVLIRHLRETGLGRNALALEYLRQAEQLPAQRREGLRDVGDRCLLIAGLFPDRARRRRVPVDYYIDLGSGAYRDLSQALRESVAELYRQLAEMFEKLVRVLMAARDDSRAELDRLIAWHHNAGDPVH